MDTEAIPPISVPVSRTLARSGDIVLSSHTFAYGYAAPSIGRLELRFQDGATADVALHGRYFVYAIPVAAGRPGSLSHGASVGLRSRSVATCVVEAAVDRDGARRAATARHAHLVRAGAAPTRLVVGRARARDATRTMQAALDRLAPTSPRSLLTRHRHASSFAGEQDTMA